MYVRASVTTNEDPMGFEEAHDVMHNASAGWDPHHSNMGLRGMVRMCESPLAVVSSVPSNGHLSCVKLKVQKRIWQFDGFFL